MEMSSDEEEEEERRTKQEKNSLKKKKKAPAPIADDTMDSDLSDEELSPEERQLLKKLQRARKRRLNQSCQSEALQNNFRPSNPSMSTMASRRSRKPLTVAEVTDRVFNDPHFQGLSSVFTEDMGLTYDEIVNFLSNGQRQGVVTQMSKKAKVPQTNYSHCNLANAAHLLTRPELAHHPAYADYFAKFNCMSPYEFSQLVLRSNRKAKCLSLSNGLVLEGTRLPKPSKFYDPDSVRIHAMNWCYPVAMALVDDMAHMHSRIHNPTANVQDVYNEIQMEQCRAYKELEAITGNPTKRGHF